MNRLIYLALAVWVAAQAFISPSRAQTESPRPYSVTAIPAWVNPASLPEKASTQTTNSASGVAFLLLDRQVNVATEQTFNGAVKRITSESGVQNESQLQFSFDPAHSKIELHAIRIVRDGKVLDRLKPESIRVIQQEKDLHRQIFNGEQSVVVILDDVRVGDEIEYAYTVTGFNPIFRGRFASDSYVQFSVPVLRHHIGVLWPKSRGELGIKLHGRKESYQLSETSESKIYSWTFDDVPAVAMEDRTPSWFNPYAWLQLTEFSNWTAVRDWALEFYSTNQKVPAEITDLAARLKSENPTPEKLTVAALRFVQDNIRYLGIEIGPNSHQPHAPEIVLNRRFGDCKDKSVLLCALLNAMGIRADPALVDINLSRLDERLPSPLAFDHVIVRVNLESRIYWLDPTLPSQRGSLAQLSVDTYPRALPIASDTVGLLHIFHKPLNTPQKTVIENLHIESYDRPASLQVKTIYEGAEAHGIRRTILENSREDLEKYYLNYYLKVYSGVRARKPLQINDEAEANRLTVSEEYELEHPWPTRQDQKTRLLDLLAFGVIEVAPRPRTYIRSMPVGLRFPAFVKHTISIDLPERGNFSNETKVISDAFQKFTFASKHVNKNLRLDFEYRTLSDSAPASSSADYLRNLNGVHEYCSYSLNFPKTGLLSPPGQVNWLIAIIGAFAGFGVMYGGWRYYRWNPPLAPVEMELDPKLNGLRGWLILIGMGVTLSPVTMLVSISKTLPAYSEPTWSLFTNPQSARFHQWAGPIFIGELIGNIILIGMVCLAALMFYQKRAGFPRLYIAYLVFNACLLTLDALAVSQIPVLQEGARHADNFGSMMKSILTAMIWSAYMLQSKRVRVTFVN